MSDDASSLFLENLPLIERIAHCVARRRRMSDDDAEEFVGEAKLHLIEDGYRVMRAFEGRSSLPAYLTMVLVNFSLDFLNHHRGKWRNSAAAEKLGPVAVALERLLSRDGRHLEEALQIVLAGEGKGVGRAELLRLVEQLPINRGRPRNAGAEALDVAIADAAEDPVEAAEKAAKAERIFGELQLALGELPTEDRLLLKLSYKQRVPAPQLAKMFTLRDRAVYGRLDHLRSKIGIRLRKAGILPQDVSEILGWRGFDSDLDWGGEE